MPQDIQIVRRRDIYNDQQQIFEESRLAPLLMTVKEDERIAVKEINWFLAKSWHLPYAKALIEEDQTRLPTAIALAERAILNRYLELHEIPEPLEERLDLWSAVAALLELKNKLVRT